MSLLKSIIYISRPRFWGYTAGPFLLGYIAGSANIYSLLSSQFLLLILFFLLPANILLYGINDYFDADTDAFNPKKKTHETLLKQTEKSRLKILLLLTLGLSLIILLILPTLLSAILFSLFILLSVFYSAPPLRFKARPFVDSASNVLYALPALVAFSLFQNSFSIYVVLSMCFWTAGMHLYSAIPDIKADKKAHLLTTAVLLGEKYSLFLCTLLYTLSVVFASLTPLSYLSLLGSIYIIIPLIGVSKPHLISKIYWYFPYINMSAGLLLFLFLAGVLKG